LHTGRRWRRAELMLSKAIIETLEKRILMSSYAVTSLADDGSSGTLRYEIQQADTAGGNQTIIFSPTLTATSSATINLSSNSLYLADGSGTLTIDGPGAGLLTINGNSLTTAIGVAPYDNAMIEGLTISGASNGINVSSHANATLMSCTITGNSGASGISVGGSVYVINSTISSNTAASGAGIYDSNGSVVVVNSTISGNVASAGGGGLYSYQGQVTVANSTIAGNSADLGGGIDLYQSTMIATDCTVATNTATGSGGGIYLAGGSTLNLYGSIIAQSVGGDIVGTAASGTNDLVGDGSGGLSASAASQNILGTTGSPINPHLGSLAYNGGPTETMALLSGSPAINAGGVFDAPFSSPETTDQTGYPRPQDATSDIGAFQAPPATTIRLSGPAAEEANSTFTLGATLIGTSVPTVSYWTVNWGDGHSNTYNTSATAITETHTYTAAGLYTIATSSVDADGSMPTTDLSVGILSGKDIGSPTVAGTSTYTNGIFTISGAGSGIPTSGTSDQFQYASTTVAGSVSLIAEVTSQGNTNSLAEAGLMIRGTTNANSPYVGLFVTPSGGIDFQYRTTSGGTSVTTSVSASEPVWLKLSSFGQVFAGYYSLDGSTWTEVGTPVVSNISTTSALAGLAVTSANTSTASQVTFQNVSLASQPAVANGWSDSDFYSPTYKGGAAYNGSTWTIAGDANSTTFNFASDAVFDGDAGITAELQSFSGGTSNVQAGVAMLGENGTDSSVLITPNGTIKFGAYDYTDTWDSYTVSGSISTPVWLQLDRSGYNMNAYYSTNGTSWTQIGSTVHGRTDTAYVGLLISNTVSTATAGLATFANISAPFSIDPPTDALHTKTYSVTLASASILSQGINTWVLNWGDSSSATVPGNSGPVSHTYSNTPTGVLITAAAYGSTGAMLSTFTLNSPSSGTGTYVGSTQDSIISLDTNSANAVVADGYGPLLFTGAIVANSSSTNAMMADGEVTIEAGKGYHIHGGITVGSMATLEGTPETQNTTTISDPLSGLSAPTSTTTYSAVALNYGSETINPGNYSSIEVGATGSLTMEPGNYIIQGGGFQVSGGGSVSGSGVSITNTDDSSGHYGSISITGNGTWSVTAPTSGTMNGVTVFQPSANTNSIWIGGSAVGGIHGTIYAPTAVVSLTGYGQVTESVDADDVWLNANAEQINSADIAGTGVAVSGTKGVSTGNVVVANFVGSTNECGCNGTTEALINWGNGTTTVGTVTENSNGGGYSVSGSTTYTEFGQYNITVSLIYKAVPIATITSVATIADAALTAGALTPPTATEGIAFSNVVVFHFTDADASDTINNFSALVQLGNGSSVTLTSTASAYGQIVAHSGGGFDVELSYTYSQQLTGATFAVTVTDTYGGNGTGGTPSSCSAGYTPFNVADQLVVVTGGYTIDATTGVSTGTQTVATFIDPGGPQAIGNYSATIDWTNAGATTSGTISYNSSTQVFTVQGSYTYSTTGTYTPKVTVTHDGMNSSAYDTADVTQSLTAVSIHYPPFFTSTAPADAYVGQTYAYSPITAVSPQGSTPLTYSIVTGSGSTTIPIGELTLETVGSNETLEWDPTAAEAGNSYQVELEVTDHTGISATQSFPIAVHPTPGNSPPIIISTPVTNYYPVGETAPTNTILPVTLRIWDDQDNAPAEFQVVSSTMTPISSLGMDGTPTFTSDELAEYPDLVNWYHNAPGTNTTQPYSLVLQTSYDGDPNYGGYEYDSLADTYNSFGTNFYPAGNLSTIFTLQAHAEFTYTGGVVDLWSNSDDDEWIYINGQLALDNGGSHAANFVTSTYSATNAATALGLEPGGTYALDIFYAQRVENSPAVLGFGSNLLLISQQQYQYNVRAVDPDNDPITYSLVDGSGSMTIDPTTGILTWADEDAASGDYPVEVKASDGRGGEDTQTYTLAVSNWNPAIGPIFTNVPATEVQIGQMYVYQPTVTDSSGNLLHFVLTTNSGTPAGMTIDPQTGLVTWTPTLGQLNQTINPEMEVIDGDGQTALQPMPITVNEAPNPDPAFGSEPVSVAVTGLKEPLKNP
jgi:fibro-slime domain-containing protein